MKKKFKLLILAVLVVLRAGCTKYVKDEDNKNVVYKETGQTLTANIICKPSEENLIKLYEENEEKLTKGMDKLPYCSDYKLNKGEFEGLWDFFVKPLAFIILKLGYLVKNMGVSVMLIGLLIRLIMLPFSKKTMIQSENMKKAQPQLMKIEKKYANKTDNDSLMAKSQETMAVYKKYNINPISGCLVSLIQLPLFFAFLEAINRVPAIFEGEFLGMNLGMTPWIGISKHNYIYIALIVLIVASTYLSFRNSMNSQPAGEANNQMQFMVKFMIVFIGIASLSLPTAIALYWIVTNGFAVVQNLILKKVIEKRK